MIEAGEHSGKLGDVLDRLADFTESREALRNTLLTAFIYPAIVTVLAFGVVTFLLVYVMPQMTRVFTSVGQTLPLATRILIALSDFARSYGLIVLAAAVAAIVVAWLMLRDEGLRRRWHAWLLGLPVVGRLIRG